MSDRLLTYCKKVGLVLNGEKTQLLVSGINSNEFAVKVGNSLIKPSKELTLLGVTYDQGQNQLQCCPSKSWPLQLK